MNTPTNSTTDRFLERATLTNFAIHGIAMVTMALVLARMLPGGGETNDIVRITMIAEHPWRFRLGWLPWQLCAVVDLWFAIALLRAQWIPKVPAAFSVLFTMAAVVPDQLAQALWITRGISMAQDAVKSGSFDAYLAFESEIFVWTASWGAFFYTLAALGWTACFAKTPAWSRLLTWLSIPTWAVMLFVTTALFFPPHMRPAPEIIAAGNALGFTLLQVWLGLVGEGVLRRRRPPSTHGRLAVWRYPGNHILGRLVDVIANSRLVAAFLEPLPDPAMLSDITNVVYINYLVPAEKLLPLVPEGLELQRLGPDGKYGLFTFLTYNHGHFGFRILGPLRRFMPSPLQTNWRIHVRDPRTGHQGIYFVTNAITNGFQALGARLLAKGMPMHVLHEGEIRRDEQGIVHLRLDPGTGSAPDAAATLSLGKEPNLDGPWKECFTNFRQFLAYCVPQDRALSTQPWAHEVTRQEIQLGIPLEHCEPLEGHVESKAAAAIIGEAQPLCFRVPNVAFRFEEEAIDPLPVG
jgi:hypothetical protein